MPQVYTQPRNTTRRTTPPIQPGEQLVAVWPDMGQRLGVSRWMAWQLVRTGAIGSLTIGDRRLVPSSWIDAYLEERASVA